MKFKCPSCGKVCQAELDESEKSEIAGMVKPETPVTTKSTKYTKTEI